MSLKKTTNRKINLEENDIVKSWCHDFDPETQSVQYKDSKTLVGEFYSKKEDPIFGTVIPIRNGNVETHKSHAENYSEVDMALSKAEHVNPIDKPRMIFNIAKLMKSHSSQDDLLEFLDKSLNLDYITKSQKNEIVKILG